MNGNLDKCEGGVTQQATDEMLKALGFTTEEAAKALSTNVPKVDLFELYPLVYHVLGLMTLAWVKAIAQENK
jgi:hypothetical protein